MNLSNYLALARERHPEIFEAKLSAPLGMPQQPFAPQHVNKSQLSMPIPDFGMGSHVMFPQQAGGLLSLGSAAAPSSLSPQLQQAGDRVRQSLAGQSIDYLKR